VVQVAEECLKKAQDLSGLLLLYTSKGSAKGLRELVALAGAQNRQNIVFLCQLLLGSLSECVDILLTSGRLPEAAFFARTYLPSRVPEVSPSILSPVGPCIMWHSAQNETIEGMMCCVARHARCTGSG
jgi:hypothetical protein